MSVRASFLFTCVLQHVSIQMIMSSKLFSAEPTGVNLREFLWGSDVGHVFGKLEK